MTKLVRIVKYWEFPDLMRQTPNHIGRWGNIQFTLEPVETCDYVIVLNHIREDIIVRCPENNVWAIMQEPYIPGTFDWMIEGHKQFTKVFTHHPPGSHHRYCLSQPALPWHVNKSYDELAGMKKPPAKDKTISWITTNKTIFPGHRLRMSFYQHLTTHQPLPIDVYGRGIKPIADKWEALAPYRYSLAIENSTGRDYWTEKIADCFLSFTLPLYYGCANIEKYFPERAFIRIDISKPDEACDIIRQAISENEWEKRLDAIAEARNKILDEYQFFPFIEKKISTIQGQTPVRALRLRAYQQSFGRKLQNQARRIKRVLIGA